MYTLQPILGSCCPRCNNEIALLKRDECSPSFHVCKCSYIEELGVGQVPEVLATGTTLRFRDEDDEQ